MELVLASEEEKRTRDVLTHPAWGQRLTVAEYLTREARLRAHAWAKDAMETWLLVARTGEAREVLASCETFRVASTFDHEQGASWLVASVYTEPALRGRGYASRLVDGLVACLATRPGAQAVALYSDVGEALYARAGFVSRPAWDRHLPAHGGAGPSGLRALLEADLPAALGEPASSPAEGRFRLVPGPAQVDWHHERERAYAALLGRPRPPTVGAVGPVGRIVWAADLKTDQLRVLLLEAPDEAAARPLLEAARATAGEAGLAEVVAWESCVPWAWPADLGERQPREGAIPMIRPLRPALLASDWRVIPRAAWV